MKELALHVLDLAQNSVRAGARSLELTVREEGGLLKLTLTDDGGGMPPELLARVTDPFSTTRTTRKVGMGLALVRLAAEQTGGGLTITSRQGVGTQVTAVFHTDHIDCPPMGDLAEAVALIIQGAPGMEVRYAHTRAGASVLFDTREVRAALGPEVSLALPEVSLWIRDYLTQLAARGGAQHPADTAPPGNEGESS